MRPLKHTINFAVCIVLCACLSVFSQSDVSQERVTIKNIVGKAEVRSPKTGKWRAARVGMTVKMKWDVRTFVESSLELLFESGTVIKLGENSVVNLSKLLQDKSSSAINSNVKVASGQIWANVKKLVSKKSKFDFETPTAVAAIRGTRLGIAVDKKKTVIDVYDGSVSVRNKGSKKVVTVTSRNRAVINKGEVDVKMYKFEEIKSETDTTSGLPPLQDPYAEDTTAELDTGIIDTGIIDTTVTDTMEGSSLEETDTTKEVYLTIESPEDNIVVDVNHVVVKGTATPGATVSIGQRQKVVQAVGNFSIIVDLVPGVNRITVTAQLGSVSKQAVVSVEYTPLKALFLSLTQPVDGMKINKPVIPVEGVTVGGAEVTVDDNDVNVRSDGSFSYQVHIPDEAGEYPITVVSRYKGKETKIERIVIYEPEREKLDLKITSPANDQVIKTNSIRVNGKAISGARIEVTGGGGSFSRSFKAREDGSFICDIPLFERDIGEYTIEVIAIDEETGDEKDKIITVEVDIKSPSINTSAPEINILSQLTGATKNGYLKVQVIDRTPEDQITLTADINGSKDQYVLDPSAQETIYLEEGKNSYIIKAVDIAGNNSSVLSGKIYYLPGPLVIDIVEPDESQYMIDDLPPMPSVTGDLYMDIEVEIDDGIGDIPETILYCRVNSSNLKESSIYVYTGRIQLSRGRNNFIIETEDMAGNKTRKVFDIVINE